MATFLVKSHVAEGETVDLSILMQLGTKVMKLLSKNAENDNFSVTVDMVGTRWEMDAIKPFLDLMGRLKKINRIIAPKRLINDVVPWLRLVSPPHTAELSEDEDVSDVDEYLEDEFAETQQM